jgi:hypothetical protein
VIADTGFFAVVNVKKVQDLRVGPDLECLGSGNPVLGGSDVIAAEMMCRHGAKEIR